MLKYLMTNDPVMIFGLVMVFVGVSIFPPLTLKEGRIGSWALWSAFVFTIGGILVACYRFFSQDSGFDHDEANREAVRVLLTMALGIALSVGVETFLGYRAGRRGGFRAFIKVVTGL